MFGEGKQRRDLNYVEDVVEALLLAGASEAAEGEIFNLGGNDPVSLAYIAEELIKMTGRGSVRLVSFPPERQSIDIGNSYSSYQKIKSVLGWQPRTPLHSGLAQTLGFYQKHRLPYWNSHDSTVS